MTRRLLRVCVLAALPLLVGCPGSPCGEAPPKVDRDGEYALPEDGTSPLGPGTLLVENDATRFTFIYTGPTGAEEHIVWQTTDE